MGQSRRGIAPVAIKDDIVSPNETARANPAHFSQGNASQRIAAALHQSICWLHLRVELCDALPEQEMDETYRIGIDIGGTFTDFTLIDDRNGEVRVGKCLTTPHAPHEAVLAGLQQFIDQLPDAVRAANAVIHATTLFTNTVLERKGALTGLLTTEGFRDVLELGRESKYEVYDPFIAFPEPLVERPLRLEIGERVLVDGSVRRTLDEDSVRAAAQRCLEAGVRTIAVVYLHSYRNPAHELRTRELLQALLPGVEISLSCEVLPEPQEYERTSTTVLNAYVKPIAASYLNDLGEALRAMGYLYAPYVMQSNGGAATFELTKQFPVQAIESGPAAGVEAASHYGTLTGLRHLLSFDMGGTTAKLCVVIDGKPSRTRTFEVDRLQRFKAGSGIPIATPVFDLLEIGSGGGSIARVNSLGLLQVGPDSAGSMPGPACYGRGGMAPTVTDANLVLGYLDAGNFLGGAMPLDATRAEEAIAQCIAGPLEMTAVQAAWGIHDLVNETMASAARVHIAEKGQNADDLVLIGFGGAGPAHAVELARKLGCPTVMIPPLPGVMSSFGLLTAPVSIERARTIRRPLANIEAAWLEAEFRSLEREALAMLKVESDVEYRRTADIWISGQDYPVEVPVPASMDDAQSLARLAQAFNAQYAALYGREEDGAVLEIVAARVRVARLAMPPSVRVARREGELRHKNTRPVYVAAQDRHVPVPVYDRGALSPGDDIMGPAIVEERESTTVIGTGDRLRVDTHGCLVITVARR